jgi:hypothetical protein
VPAASLIAAGRDYQLQNQLKLLIANQTTYAIALGLVKTSLLLSLIRIFHVFKRFRVVASCVIAFCICWAIQTILIAFLICRPISYNWDQVNQKGSCGNLTAAYTSIGIVDVISDIIIFALPIPVVNSLKMRQGSKWATMGLFALGIFTVAAGAVRTGMIFHVQFHPTDPEGPTQNLIWAAIEPCIAITVASLLVFKPLLVFVRAKVSSIISLLPYGSVWSTKGTSRGMYGSTDGTTRSRKGYAPQKSESERELQNLAPGKIWMTTELHVHEGNLSRVTSSNGVAVV